MKAILTFGALSVVVLTQAGCGTQIQTMSLQAAKPTLSTDTSGVALYFGAQAHPAVLHTVGPASIGARIGRKPGDTNIASCDAVLGDALSKLRSYALDHKGNAVINVRTSFHTTETESDTNYTCGISPSAASIRVSGDVVVLDHH